MEFPLDYVRGRFPSLADGRTYLDGASSGRPLATVEALTAGQRRPDEPGDVLEETRESLASFLNSNEAWAEDEIVLAESAEALLQRTAETFAKRLSPGDEVLVTEIDEEWCLAPWLALEAQGVRVKFWPPKRPWMTLDESRLDELLTEKTRLVVVTKACASLGTIVELLPVALRLREHPSALLINWTPFLAHGAADVRFLRADMVFASASAFFGASGGFLWGKKEFLRELAVTPSVLADGIGLRAEDVAALGAGLRYIEELGLLSQDMQIQPSEDYGRRRHMRRGMQAIRHIERSLTALALRRLGAVRGLELYGIRDEDLSAHRAPRFYFKLGALEPATVVEKLLARGIVVEHGSGGCPRVAKALGLPRGAVFASMAHYNSEEEIERFSDALHEIAAERPV